MKIQQLQFSSHNWHTTFSTDGFAAAASQLALIFGEPSLITDPSVFNHLRSLYPSAALVFASTSGEILGDRVFDQTIVVTALQLEKTAIRSVETNIKAHKNSEEAGRFLLEQLQQDDLKAVFIISDGTDINGSELVAGFNEKNESHIPVTGGLAGDAARFVRTYAGLNKVPDEGNVVAIGFYGSHIQVGHGSFGGWDPFGPTRKITRAAQNVLYEIDGKNALDYYKDYLGPYKDELPGSALLFPLSIKEEGTGQSVVRTILSVNESDKSMTFAGNMPVGSEVRMMKANFDKLIDASSIAAKNTYAKIPFQPELAILISCVGRKLILQERTEEEVQAARDIFGAETCTTGFYSYGEISPFQQGTSCNLHNQTMTITTLKED